MVKLVIPPGSDGGICGKVILFNANIAIPGGGVIGGVKAALTVNFSYPNAQNLNIDSIIDHLKSDYSRNNKISFIRIIQLKVKGKNSPIGISIPSN